MKEPVLELDLKAKRRCSAGRTRAALLRKGTGAEAKPERQQREGALPGHPTVASSTRRMSDLHPLWSAGSHCMNGGRTRTFRIWHYRENSPPILQVGNRPRERESLVQGCTMAS